MNWYYLLVLAAVVMFGGCFALNDVYRKMRGSNLLISLQFSLTSTLATLPIMIAIAIVANGFRFECTPFTLLMSFLTALNGFGFTFCSFKALGKINLSLYSLFSMLGGMVLPFIQGLFMGDKLTLAKAVCFVLICVALLLTVKKGNGKKSGGIYYVGVFVLNGMSGVLATFFSKLPFEKTSKEAFSVWSCVWTVLLAVVLLLILRKKMSAPKLTFAAFGVSVLGSVGNKVANLFLLACRGIGADGMPNIQNTVLDPLVTGGVMIVSTLICFFGKNKPSKKEIISIAVASLGMVCLFAIPI